MIQIRKQLRRNRNKGFSGGEATLITCLGTVIAVILALSIVAGLEFFSAWLFLLLWNWLMPLIFHLPTLTFWEAFGCTVLLSFVGGFFKSTTTTKTEK